MGERALRATLWIAAGLNLGLGLLMLLAPGTFFEEIGNYGARNDHYVGDAGAFYLAAAFGLAVAAVRADWRVPVLGLGAVWIAIHALNHLFDVGQAESTARGIADTAGLAALALGSAYLARVSARLRHNPERRVPEPHAQ